MRLAESRYENDVDTPYEGAADPLEVARIVFDQDGDMPNSANLSTMFTTWGQFLDHDLVLTPESEEAGLLAVSGMPHDIHRSDFEIGEDGARIPLNAITWQLDGSNVYGSTEDRAALLRAFEGGKLRVSEDASSARDLLPQADPDSPMAGDIEGDNPVYLAGDIRANENPNLLSMHTLFVREHNYWAERLAELHPDWDDEQLYDGARQIVEYEMQKITYEEWLPHLVGDAVDEEWEHDPDVIGQMSVEFSTAAFRFGHTLVSDNIDNLNDDGTDAGSETLMDAFFDHTSVQENGIENVLRGQLDAHAQELDAQIVDALNFFLETPDGISGFSLAALNMARGLDHGLQSYVDTRAALLGDIDPATLDPLDFSIISSNPGTQERLAAAFEDVFQVDLWTGGLAEDQVAGAQLGPLFTLIVADQFTRTRAADETFGTLDPALGEAVLAEVEGTSFADIITRNTDVDYVQDDVFVVQDRTLTVADAPEGTWQDDDITLAARDVDEGLKTEDGDDSVTLIGGTQIRGDVEMGAGNDTLAQSSGDIHGDVRAGSGDDEVTLSGSAVLRGDLRAEDGNDQVRLADMAQVRGDVRGGAGDDEITLEGRARIDGDLRGGAGDDRIELGADAGVGGMVRGGAGDDVVTLHSGADVALIDGGAGHDTLALSGDYTISYGPEPGSGTVHYLDADGAPTGEVVKFRNVEAVTCFTPGTRLITERGKMDIAELRLGDRVWTLDRGLQPIRWIGRTTVPAQGALAPIRIAAGALGNGRDLWVSPQHRMMVQGWQAELYCADAEVLVPAKGLINDAAIRPQSGGSVTYIHIAFNAHEIVFAEGIPSESLHTGPEALASMPAEARAELLALFPELHATGQCPRTARPVMTVREARVLAAARGRSQALRA
ncbi:MAG: peroxidase family protein [Pseudomonadota bacterium]